MDKTARILHVFGSLNMGGAESRIMDVYRAIDRSKFQFDFLTMQEDAQYFEEEIKTLGGSVIKLPPPRKSGAVNNLRQMQRIMQQGNYDAVHAHTSFHCGVAMLAAKRAGVPVRITHARTTGSKQSGILAKLRLQAGRALIHSCSTCRLAISEEAGRYLFGNSQFSVLPNAINLEKYRSFSESALHASRVEADLQPEDFVLGLVGRFDRMKNQGFALKVLESIMSQKPSAKLVFVGDGPLRPEVTKKAAEMGIAEQVRFMGVRSDVPVWMRLFDVLLVPSLFEGLGGVILEAQAAGTPVIKSDCFTNAADLGLGMVQCCSLGEPEAWVHAINNKPEVPDQTNIFEAFHQKGYSLDAEVEFLCQCYQAQ